MEKKPFISVVMPIYNVEKHLKTAINSVLEQSFQDFELILVDDCSPDKCPSICDEYALKYDKISVIHHEKNKGLSEARNTGLEVANGEYIWFMDSDDYVELDLFEKIYSSIQKNRADVVTFGLIEEYYNQDDTLHHTHAVCPVERYYDTKEELRKNIIDLEVQTLYGYAWNKFYRLDYLKTIGLKYEIVTLIEDILFNVKYCMNIEKMNVLAITPYHYNKRMDNSLTAKFVPTYYELHRRRIELIYNQYKEWNMCDESVKSKLATLYTRYIFSALQRNCDVRANMTLKNRVQWMESVFEERIFKDLIPYGKPESTVLKVMISCLKKKRVYSCLILGRLIYVVKKKLPMLFTKVKQNR